MLHIYALELCKQKHQLNGLCRIFPLHTAICHGREGWERLENEISRALYISVKVITQQAVNTTVTSISSAQPPVHL